ncbi:hypothetical protein ACWD6I_04470 [Streptomyces sp. NPDC002454]
MSHPTGPAGLPRRRAPKLVSSHGRPVGDRTPRPAEPAPAPPDLPRRRRFPEATTAAPGTDDAVRSIQPTGDPSRRDRSGPDRRRPAPDGPTPAAPPTGALPRRVRQTHLAPQLKDGPDRRSERVRPVLTERDAEQVRSRMASLQRGWARGREENAEGDTARGGTAHGTTSEGDGR